MLFTAVNLPKQDRKRIQQLIEYDPVVAARAGASSKSDANVDALLLKIESLNAQLNEQVIRSAVRHEYQYLCTGCNMFMVLKSSLKSSNTVLFILS
jgi:cell division protein FtsB